MRVLMLYQTNACSDVISNYMKDGESVAQKIIDKMTWHKVILIKYVILCNSTNYDTYEKIYKLLIGSFKLHNIIGFF